MKSLIARGWPAFLLLFLGAGAFCAASLRRLTVDAGTNILLNDDDPDLHYYNLTRAEWEYDEYTIVCVRSDEWFSKEGIALLNDFTAALGRIPDVEKVVAINTLPLVRNRPLNLFKLEFPDLRSGARIDRAKDELLGLARTRRPADHAGFAQGPVPLGGHTQALGNLISEDGRNLSVLVYLLVSDDLRRLEPEWNRLHGEPATAETKRKIDAIRPGYERAIKELRERRTALIRAIREVCRAWQPRFRDPVRLSGLPVVNVNLVEHVESDLRTFGIAAVAVFFLGFAAVFRKVRWTALPIVACVLPVVLVLGTMALLGKRITVITSNMPVLLFVLMLPYTVYFVERYRERRAADPAEDARLTVARSAGDIWTPCFYSATTTMAGTASLMTSGISPVRTFGLMMTVGMAVGLGSVFLFLPSAVHPLRPLAARPPRTRGPLHRLAGVALGAPRTVVAVSLAILAVAIWGATKLDVETKFIDYFRKDSEVYRGLEYIDTRMGGTTPMEIMLRSDRPGFFKTKQGLAAIRAAEAFFRGVPETGNTRSLATLVDEFHKAAPKASEEMLLSLLLQSKSGRGLAREYCNADFTTTRVLVRMRETAPTLNRKRILAGLRAHLDSRPELAGLTEKRPTGVFVLYSNMLQSLVKSQKDTFLIVLVSIYLMLVVLFRNPFLALLVLLPQVLPVLVVLGTMGFARIPLDMVTTMIASVAMGVGIDPAIQYTVRFRRELAGAPSREEAIRRAHATIGRAIAIGGGIVFCGFGVLVLSRFVPTVYFGLFTGLAVLMGIVASLTTLPAMFALLGYPRR
ncbi:MAG: MMPL family transporter [Planctomycetes bacterium]|nr:MMPL family transporter [Planctomycetota bacterium]